MYIYIIWIFLDDPHDDNVANFLPACGCKIVQQLPNEKHRGLDAWNGYPMLSPSSSKQRCRQIFVTLSPCNLCSLLPVLHDCSNALPQSLLEQVDKVM